jgi:pimeloyl-ACP methyl ester carboxylesterase
LAFGLHCRAQVTEQEDLMAAASVISNLGKLAHDAGRRIRQHLHQPSSGFVWPLRAAIEAERHVIATADAGAISYYEDTAGEGRPLVLLHGIHAAGSAFEMRTLFNEFRGERPVYALDLPGFGFSQRGGMRYSAKTYVRAIEHLLRHIANEREDQRADLVALSLSSEYAATVAAELPDLVHSLVLISPTGFDSKQPKAREGTPNWLQKLARAGGELFFDALVTRPSLKHYLRKSFAGRVDRSLLEYSHATSHQPGAHFAPLAFVSGELFPKGDPQQTYARVKVPVLVMFDEDPYTDFAGLRAFVSKHDNYQTLRVSRTRGLPQIEARERTILGLRSYWDRVDAEGTGGQRRAEHDSYAHA